MRVVTFRNKLRKRGTSVFPPVFPLLLDVDPDKKENGDASRLRKLPVDGGPNRSLVRSGTRPPRLNVSTRAKMSLKAESISSIS